MKLELDVTPYNIIILATIFVGVTFSMLLIFTQRINQKANVFLGLVLVIITLWMAWVLGIDFDMDRYFPNWSLFPLQYSLGLGPLIYLYVKKLSDSSFKIKPNILIHFVPLLLELGIHYLLIRESLMLGIPTYGTSIFFQFNPVIQLLATSSILVYLGASLKEIKKFDSWLKDNYSDVYKYQLNWLKRLLILFTFFWLLWIPYSLIDYFVYDYLLDTRDYYPLYICLAGITIWLGAEAFLRPELIIMEPMGFMPSKKENPSIELMNAGTWLQNQMEINLFYRNSELTLKSLAEELDIHPHELSKITNNVLGKSFNDFVNEYRVQDFMTKLKDPKYANITLLGIAFDSGFNSKTTFNRTFKNITGKSPLEYKNEVKISPIL